MSSLLLLRVPMHRSLLRFLGSDDPGCWGCGVWGDEMETNPSDFQVLKEVKSLPPYSALVKVD